MGVLKDKILTYNPEIYRPFTDTTVSTSAAKFGTLTADTITLGAATQITYVADGPIGESQDSWNFQQITGTGGARISHSQTASIAAVNDKNFSTGLWVKWVEYPSGSAITQNTIFTGSGIVSATGPGFLVSGVASGAGGNARKLVLQTSNGTALIATYSTNLIPDDQQWHYVAIRRNDTAIEVYFDGVLWVTATNPVTTAPTGSFSYIGPGAFPQANYNVRLSNFYLAPYATIDATAISEIWTAGSTTAGTDITITETPATADALQVLPTILTDSNNLAVPAEATALMTEPTIVTTIGDSTYVTTSFIASALSPSDVSVIIVKNNNFVVTEILEASIELINNVIVSTGSDVDFSAPEFIASAEMVKARVAEVPFIASATMPGGNAVVQANYYSLVTALNPYLYVYDGKSTTTTNSGYQTGTFTKDLNLQTLQNLGNPLNLVGEGKSWLGPSGSSDGKFRFTTATTAESFSELVSTGTFAWEAWIKPSFLPYYFSDSTLFFVRGPIRFALVPQVQNAFPQPNTVPKVRVQIQNSATGSSFHTFEINRTSTPFSANNWAHVVVQSYDDGTAGKRRAELWINGSRYITEQYSYADWTSTTTTDTIFGSDHITQFGTPIATFSGQGIDEVAIYSQALTNSQIIQHNNFIGTLSPNVEYNADFMDADVNSGDHAVLAIDNVTIAETPATGNALFVNPAILAVKNLSISAIPLIASATNTDVVIYYGWTIYADPSIAAAESKEGFALNTIYYDYVQANVAPYRYVNFDTATPFADFGSDTDYSVSPTVVGGTIVNPDLGINGKSAKTAGISYITDGVILKESEHDDNWGTGNNSWHSSFWVQRAIDDNSTTGLRVLWNLNGAYDDQNIILYHYQNKLHLQINNQVGAPITITSANNVNIFDYERHNIVINSHHNNNKNHLYVYVDAVLILDQDINTYAVTTINNPIHVGANDEANNFARLGIGCLITPFADTALPVVPTNTKLIVDEVYWDKNQILQAQVIAIFDMMPDKNNNNNMVMAFEAAAESVMPAISTTANFVAAPATASEEFVDPSLFVVRLVDVAADSMNVSALMTEATGFVPINIVADVFVVTAIFNDPGLTFTIPGATMIANVELVNRPNPFILPTDNYGISVSTNGIRYELREFSPYIKYLRIVARSQKIYKDMEIL